MYVLHIYYVFYSFIEQYVVCTMHVLQFYLFSFGICLQPFRVMPWYSWIFLEAIKSSNLQFASDQK